jgi:NAD(P)-dependent dehydrogenase (short-subunit alcohol dehydrogenase family)
MERLLEDKVAIVTGGGKELGFAIASGLAMDGARVLIVSRSEERARGAVSKIRDAGGRVEPHVDDITAPEAAQRIMEAAVQSFGGIDILVNSAGVFVWKKFLDLTVEDWDQTISTNLSAAFHLTQAAARAMIERGRGGSIINIASIHAFAVDPNVAAQCASKAGLVGLTRAAAEALRDHDIRVNAIAPGSIEPDSPARRGESPRMKVTQGDVASLAIYLASDLARSLTGATLEAYGNTRVTIRS